MYSDSSATTTDHFNKVSVRAVQHSINIRTFGKNRTSQESVEAEGRHDSSWSRKKNAVRECEEKKDRLH